VKKRREKPALTASADSVAWSGASLKKPSIPSGYTSAGG
jgi:hypothetical protein